MSKYFVPLGVFVIGNFALLVAFLFMPTIGAVSDNLSAETANISHIFWGWTWAVGGTRLWVYLALEAAVLFTTAKAFLAIK